MFPLFGVNWIPASAGMTEFAGMTGEAGMTGMCGCTRTVSLPSARLQAVAPSSRLGGVMGGGRVADATLFRRSYLKKFVFDVTTGLI